MKRLAKVKRSSLFWPIVSDEDKNLITLKLEWMFLMLFCHWYCRKKLEYFALSKFFQSNQIFAMKRLAKVKRSSLFCPTISDEDKKLITSELGRCRRESDPVSWRPRTIYSCCPTGNRSCRFAGSYRSFGCRGKLQFKKKKKKQRMV